MSSATLSARGGGGGGRLFGRRSFSLNGSARKGSCFGSLGRSALAGARPLPNRLSSKLGSRGARAGSRRRSRGGGAPDEYDGSNGRSRAAFAYGDSNARC